MPLISRLISFALVWSLIHCAVHAQENTIVRFVCFPRSDDTEPLELLLTTEEKVPETIKIETPTNSLSSPYKVKNPGVWAVGKTIKTEDGKSTFTNYGRSKALASSSQLILLIRKGAKNADGFEVIPFDNTENFSGGKFLMVNASRVDIAGTLGQEKFAIAPRAHAIVKPTPDKNGRTIDVQFFFRTEEGVRPFSSTRWPINDKARGLIFFYHDPETTLLQLHTIRDFLP